MQADRACLRAHLSTTPLHELTSFYLAAAGLSPDTLLTRHAAGDWGDVGAEDATENDLSLARGFRLLSSYRAGDARIWIITERDRSATTLLLPEEY